MTDVSSADPAVLRMISRNIVMLVEHADVLGEDLAASLLDLRTEITRTIGEHEYPQVAPKGVIRHAAGSYQQDD